MSIKIFIFFIFLKNSRFQAILTFFYTGHPHDTPPQSRFSHKTAKITHHTYSLLIDDKHT